MRNQHKAVIFVVGIVACCLVGCSRQDNSKTPFEQILTGFKDGKKDESVQTFIDSDWHVSPAFSANSPMNAKEADFAKLAVEKQSQITGEVLEQTNLIRSLAKGVLDKSNSIAKSDPKQAQKGKAMLKELGKKMDQPEGLMVLQSIGRSYVKLGN